MTTSKRLIAVATFAVGLLAHPAHAQLVVNDPLNTAQAIALVQKTINEYSNACPAVPDNRADVPKPAEHGAVQDRTDRVLLT